MKKCKLKCKLSVNQSVNHFLSVSKDCIQKMKSVNLVYTPSIYKKNTIYIYTLSHTLSLTYIGKSVNQFTLWG